MPWDGTDNPASTSHNPLRALDLSQRLQIYFQGILDTACFPYALANAYKALAGKKVTREHWNRATAQLPDASAFLGGPGATQFGDEGVQHHIEVLLAEFGDPGESFTLDQLGATAGIADFCDVISPNSVVVFAYGGPSEFQNAESHIVCGLAATDGPKRALHVACSTAFWGRYLKFGEYFERHDPLLNRWSNDSFPTDTTATIGPNFRWRITLSRDC